jgi:plasmid stabilization system protein ParE
MKRLRLKSSAQHDYCQAIIYYEARQTGLGRSFEAELGELFERIRRNPEHFPAKTPTIRKAVMPRFKYGVFFTVTADEIGVVAIYHPSRNPQSLQRRL